MKPSERSERSANVLDVACGTGGPGLTLARLSPGVHLLGIDSAAGMIEVARRKAAYQHLSKARFEVASADTLPCADGGMDAVFSRFGLMLFGDTAASARELARVLRPGGHFSLAVWGNMAENRLVGASWAAQYLASGFDVVATDPAPNAEADLRSVEVDFST